MNITLLIFIIWYLSCGMGFALASWLQATEDRVHKHLIPRDYVEELRKFLFFTLVWWVIAIYCYRAEIKGTALTLKEAEERYGKGFGSKLK